MRPEHSEFSQFDGARLRVLLAELDDELTPEKLRETCRIVIVGGAAVALRVPNRVTHDVDVVSEAMPMALRRAAARVADRHRLRPDRCGRPSLRRLVPQLITGGQQLDPMAVRKTS